MARAKNIRPRGDFGGLEPGQEGEVPDWQLDLYPHFLQRVSEPERASSPKKAKNKKPESPPDKDADSVDFGILDERD